MGPLVDVPHVRPPPPPPKELLDCTPSKAHDFKEEWEGGTMRVGVRKQNALTEREPAAFLLLGGYSRGGGGGRTPGLSLWGKQRGFATPTETNSHGDTLRFMFKTRTRRKTTKAVLNNGWRLVAVGGCWRLLAVGSWRLVAVGGWRLAVGGGWRSLGAVLKGCP